MALRRFVVFAGLVWAACGWQPDRPTRPPSARRPHRRDVARAALPIKQKRGGNAEGLFFVDESCVACDVCAWVGGDGTFGPRGPKYAVLQQPTTGEAKTNALRAMVACPAGAIRTMTPQPEVVNVQPPTDDAPGGLFPLPVDERRLPGVYHLGFHSLGTNGAAPYLIVREEGLGNIMVDMPRWNRRLGEALDALGGVDYIVMTSKETTAGHDQWHLWFPEAVRVLHSLDVTLPTQPVEQALPLAEAWVIDDQNQDPRLKLLWTPGRTHGAISVWYHPPGEEAEAAVFTGGHLGFNVRGGRLDGFSGFNEGGGLERQASSMRRLANKDECDDWQWLLPGQGRRVRFDSPAKMREEVKAAADWFAASPRALM